MKSLRLFIAPLFALSLLIAGGNSLPVADAHIHTQQGEQEAEPEKPAYHYVCPMHADVTAKKPGKCYKCKMKLEKKRVKVNKPSDQ
jgi:hypothetical protein